MVSVLSFLCRFQAHNIHQGRLADSMPRQAKDARPGHILVRRASQQTPEHEQLFGFTSRRCGNQPRGLRHRRDHEALQAEGAQAVQTLPIV